MRYPVDILDRPLTIGSKVGVAFASSSSRGYLRVGVLEEIEEDYIKVRWEDGKLSPKMVYGSRYRWVLL